MHRSGDMAAILAIVLGIALARPTYEAIGDALGTDVRVRIERREDQRREGRRSERGRRFERRIERGGGPSRGCAVPFRIDSRGPGWSVGGEYSGLAALTSEGLVIELRSGATTAQIGDADVRAVVLGLTEESGDGRWLVAHRAEAIPVGAIPEGETRELRGERLLIPGVGREELESGWLVVEHVLADPDAEGGTAWTYAHASRDALEPLAMGRCDRG